MKKYSSINFTCIWLVKTSYKLHRFIKGTDENLLYQVYMVLVEEARDKPINCRNPSKREIYLFCYGTESTRITRGYTNICMSKLAISNHKNFGIQMLN